MAWEVGWSGQCEIVRNTIETIGDKDAVRITVRHPETDEDGNALIFLTPKSMGIARAQLRACGFDPDSGLENLLEPLFLSGKIVPIYVDEWNGKAQLRIETKRSPSKATIAKYDEAIRKAKHDDSDAGQPSLLAEPRRGGSAATGKRSPKPATEDDEIPF